MKRERSFHADMPRRAAIQQREKMKDMMVHNKPAADQQQQVGYFFCWLGFLQYPGNILLIYKLRLSVNLLSFSAQGSVSKKVKRKDKYLKKIKKEKAEMVTEEWMPTDDDSGNKDSEDVGSGSVSDRSSIVETASSDVSFHHCDSTRCFWFPLVCYGPILWMHLFLNAEPSLCPYTGLA